ncbi:hypothetical protein Tco_0922417 [Tanacetum coccineum]|uniref:Uncharacterized protein n=1 Tax=Tanacetum coccineum TaxID=301880 RepID=A0ABQ5D0H0_9ASTR
MFDDLGHFSVPSIQVCLLLVSVLDHSLWGDREQLITSNNPTWCDPEWEALMGSCWSADPTERPFGDREQLITSNNPTWCDPEWKALMGSCWSADPTERPFVLIFVFCVIEQKFRENIVDVLILGKWSRSNVHSMVQLLQCFHQVSGLKLNLHKSNLYGVGVNCDDVRNLASLTGCKSHSLPFVYLGLPVGMNMSRIKGWGPILTKFKNRLSKWKASMLSIGGRSTLVSSVLGALGIYYLSLFPMPVNIANSLEAMKAKFFWGSTDDERKMQWIEWKFVLASKKYGGLGIGSLQALNISLIQKWRWRYVHNHHALWVKVISSIHGLSNNGISFDKLQKNSMWARIINSIKAMHDKGIILHSSLRRKINNGVSIKFWHDIWIGDSSLSTRFPRLFLLDTHPDFLVRDRWINGSWSWSWSRYITGGSLFSQLQDLSDLLHNSQICDIPDVWEWSIGGTNSFSVKDTRVHIDNFILPDVHSPTRWICYIPKKVNIMIWRVLRDHLPTRWNLSRKASEIWLKVFLWLDLVFLGINSFAASFDWVEDLQIRPQAKHIVQSILGITAWSIWKFRNGCIFSHKRPN